MNPINHVAIIMDGNGRLGITHKKSRMPTILVVLESLATKKGLLRSRRPAETNDRERLWIVREHEEKIRGANGGCARQWMGMARSE